MKLSVIIPAFNEENYLPATLEAVCRALSGVELQSEIITVDNESTDNTARIAADFGAKVVSENIRNIGKVRNAGAKAASGDVLIFIDADTRVPESLLNKISEAMKNEKCFGGAVAVEYDELQRNWMKFYLFAWKFWEKFFNMRQGAAQFCRKAFFEKLGGYDEGIFVGEDIEFYWRLSKFARQNGGHLSFIKQPKVKTSARRLDKIPFLKTFVLMNPIFIRLFWRKKKFWKAWYEKTIR